jgi:hypothetical protein
MATSAMTDTKSYLADVPHEYAFWCCDGRILKNLRELRDAFAVMNDGTFTYHVNDAKNDFHSWVKDIVKDDTLAAELLTAGSPMTAVRVVTDRIAFLSARPASAPVKKPASSDNTHQEGCDNGSGMGHPLPAGHQDPTQGDAASPEQASHPVQC